MLPAVEESVASTTLTWHVPTSEGRRASIVAFAAALDVDETGAVSLAHLFDLLMARSRRAEPAQLRTNGLRIAAFVRGADGGIQVVSVYQGDGRWHLNAVPVSDRAYRLDRGRDLPLTSAKGGRHCREAHLPGLQDHQARDPAVHPQAQGGSGGSSRACSTNGSSSSRGPATAAGSSDGRGALAAPRRQGVEPERLRLSNLGFRCARDASLGEHQGGGNILNRPFIGWLDRERLLGLGAGAASGSRFDLGADLHAVSVGGRGPTLAIGAGDAGDRRRPCPPPRLARGRPRAE